MKPPLQSLDQGQVSALTRGHQCTASSKGTSLTSALSNQGCSDGCGGETLKSLDDVTSVMSLWVASEPLASVIYITLCILFITEGFSMDVIINGLVVFIKHTISQYYNDITNDITV